MCIRAKRKEIIIPEQFDILPEESKIILEEYRKNTEVCRKGVKVKKETSLSGSKEPPPLWNDENLDVSLKQCQEELRADQSWAETLCMNTRLSGHPEFTPETFSGYLQRFFAKLANEGIKIKSPADAKSHFARWLAIELEKQKRNGNQNRNPYSSKQEANDYALHALQERMEQRRSGLQEELPKPF